MGPHLGMRMAEEEHRTGRTGGLEDGLEAETIACLQRDLFGDHGPSASARRLFRSRLFGGLFIRVGLAGPQKATQTVTELARNDMEMEVGDRLTDLVIDTMSTRLPRRLPRRPEQGADPYRRSSIRSGGRSERVSQCCLGTRRV